MRYIKYAVIVIFLLNLNIVYTQELIEIKGKIVDKYQRGIITVLKVQDQSGHTLTYFTDTNGKFSIRLPQGKYTFTINKGSEYEVKIIPIDLNKITKEELIIQLNRLYDIRQDGWYGGDVHMHSIFSDGLQFPSDLVIAARSMGLSWVVLTDHNTISGKCLWDRFKDPDFVTIMGEEVTTLYGHFNAIGIEKLISWKIEDKEMDIKRIYEDVHRQGGIVVLNHPFFPNRSYKFWNIEGYDLIEIWNGGAPPNLKGVGNYEAKLKWFGLLNKGGKLPAVAGSDCHDITSVLSAIDYFIVSKIFKPRLDTDPFGPMAESFKAWLNLGLYIGNPRTYIYIKKLCIDEVINALRNGNSFMTNGPIVIVDINGKYPGETLDISTESSYALNMKILSNSPVTKVVVIKNGEILQEIHIDNANIYSTSIKLEPKNNNWILVEVYGKYPIYAITNPIYFK